jgi:hypothetical protein
LRRRPPIPASTATSSARAAALTFDADNVFEFRLASHHFPALGVPWPAELLANLLSVPFELRSPDLWAGV